MCIRDKRIPPADGALIDEIGVRLEAAGLDGGLMSAYLDDLYFCLLYTSHSVDDGMNNSASRMPNCADEIVAPVVGETNLFMHSCCMIRPATLMPTPVHSIASRRGRREMSRIAICSRLPLRIAAASRSSTPRNSDASESATSAAASSRVSLCSLMVGDLPSIVR